MFDPHQSVVHLHQSVCAPRWCPSLSRYRRHEPFEFRCHPMYFFSFYVLDLYRLSIGMIQIANLHVSYGLLICMAQIEVADEKNQPPPLLHYNTHYKDNHKLNANELSRQ